jgi:hypothetical protein
MAADTLRLLEVIHRHGTMTGATDKIFVLTLEWKLGIIPMIKFHLGPALGIMAILTLLAIAAFVHIIFFMTRITVLG